MAISLFCIWHFFFIITYPVFSQENIDSAACVQRLSNSSEPKVKDLFDCLTQMQKEIAILKADLSKFRNDEFPKGKYFVATNGQVGDLDIHAKEGRYDLIFQQVVRYCGDKGYATGVWDGGGNRNNGYGVTCIQR